MTVGAEWRRHALVPAAVQPEAGAARMSRGTMQQATSGRSARSRRASLSFLLVAAAISFSGCGSDGSPTDGGAANAQILLTIEPTPVVAVQDPLFGTVSASYKVVLKELAGLGGEIVFVHSTVFDPQTGFQAGGGDFFDGTDLAVYIGTKRIEAGGTLTIPRTVSYALSDLRKAATLTVTVQVRDDHQRVTNQSILVPIE